MVDEINDVRIIGVITAVVMMAIALAGLSWESKVTWVFSHTSYGIAFLLFLGDDIDMWNILPVLTLLSAH